MAAPRGASGDAVTCSFQVRQAQALGSDTIG